MLVVRIPSCISHIYTHIPKALFDNTNVFTQLVKKKIICWFSNKSHWQQMKQGTNNNTEDLYRAQIQKHRGKPLLFHDKCSGFFYVHYTTHGTYSFTSHPKDEAIVVKCLAQGHKCCNRPGFELESNTLGHDTPAEILQVYMPPGRWVSPPLSMG